jgi:hypothetical protein
LVIIVRPLLELNIFEIMSPDRKSSSTGRPSKEAIGSISLIYSRTYA